MQLAINSRLNGDPLSEQPTARTAQVKTRPMRSLFRIPAGARAAVV